MREGALAPDFALPDQDGRVWRLSELRGRWVVLYVYPKDFTPGCTREAEAFLKAQAALSHEGAQVLGLSADPPERHRRFAEKLGLTFPLLSDPEARVIRELGAWGTKNLYGKKSEGILRQTYVIDPEGRVVKVIRRAKVEAHPEKALAALREAKNEA